MCGINGILRLTDTAPPIDRDELLRTRDAMTARGPDGSGAWISADGRAALASRRLAILDLSEAGAQPMLSEDGRFALVMNGEIYNFLELRRELEAEGVRVPLAERHGGGARPLCPGGRGHALAPAGHVRPRDLGRPGEDAAPRPGPAGHQASLPLGRRAERSASPRR